MALHTLNTTPTYVHRNLVVPFSSKRFLGDITNGSKFVARTRRMSAKTTAVQRTGTNLHNKYTLALGIVHAILALFVYYDKRILVRRNYRS